MAEVTVDNPCCDGTSTVELPDGASVKKVTESYKTGQWGPDNLVEMTCACGTHFGVEFKDK